MTDWLDEIKAVAKAEGLEVTVIGPNDPIPGCEKCGHISCVCAVKEKHLEGCKFRTSVTCPVAVECEHGYDVCPICDPCTCADVKLKARTS